MIYFLLTLVSTYTFAQVASKPFIDTELLDREAKERSIIIRGYKSKYPDKNYFNATGTLLKDGYFIINLHTLQSYLSGEKVVYEFKVSQNLDKRLPDLTRITNIKIIKCDEKLDLCLMKTENSYKFKYFTLVPPPFRKVSASSPLGLFNDEILRMYGNAHGSPDTQEVRYRYFTTDPYKGIVKDEPRRDAPSMIFTDPTGNSSIADRGDSGGPIYDINLYLYGIVRGKVKIRDQSYNIAVPTNEISTFFDKHKDLIPEKELLTVEHPNDLGKFFTAK